MDLSQAIRSIPDFPKKGIIFRDITTLLKDPEALKETMNRLALHYKDEKIDRIVGIESRGFIFGTPLALELGCGFILIRKPGKLPAEVVSQEYELEYGTDKLEIHKDAIETGERVLIVDDLLATGGTAEAACSLVEKVGGEIAGCAFVIELDFLEGRKKLTGRDIFSIVHY